jgi:1,4-alpha-glucan branching enzyme
MTSISRDGEVEFRFFRPGAAKVCVVGDFTAWQTNPIPMIHEGKGWWIVRLNLGDGEYRFRYMADGRWYSDFASHGVEMTNNQWNSVLVVAAKRVARRAETTRVRLAA